MSLEIKFTETKRGLSYNSCNLYAAFYWVSQYEILPNVSFMKAKASDLFVLSLLFAF